MDYETHREIGEKQDVEIRINDKASPMRLAVFDGDEMVSEPGMTMDIKTIESFAEGYAEAKKRLDDEE